MFQPVLIPPGPSDRRHRLAGGVLLEADEIDVIVKRMAAQIVDRNQGRPLIVLAGVRTRGEVLAGRLAEAMAMGEPAPRFRIEMTSLDITHYRDDKRTTLEPVVLSDTLSATVDGRCVIIVDDVLYTGRTVRAAMDALLQHGRPAIVELAVLINRGLRELPIRPDFFGRTLGTTPAQWVYANFTETDGEQRVRVCELEAAHDPEQRPLLTLMSGGFRIRSRLDALTDRELDVLEALARDANKKAVGHRLGITAATVRAHLENALAKLAFKSALQAIVFYHQEVQSGWRRRDQAPA